MTDRSRRFAPHHSAGGRTSWLHPAALAVLLACTLTVPARGQESATQAPPGQSADRRQPRTAPGSDQRKETGRPESPLGLDTDQQPTEIEELRRRIEVLAEEVEKLRSGEVEVELSEERRRSLGLASSAAATYRKRQGVSFAGYGEMLYERFSDRTENDVSSRTSSRLDFLRAILYAGYRFNDKFIFNSEIEIEHATEISIEFAYLDYLLNDHLTIRGGMLLVPLGLVNEFHEPTVFIGARRPETERRIIPTTWHENGVGVLGSAGRFNYRAYVVNGMNASGFSSDGLRGGRQGGGEALAENMAFAGRLDVIPMPGAFAGVGVYTGGSGQGLFGGLDVNTTIAEAHGQVQMRGVDFRALYARASVDEAARLNAARHLTSGQGVAETMHGGYAQVGYNVLSQVSSRMTVMPFYRLEKVDTQAELPAGFQPDGSRDGVFHTLGLEFRPIYNVVVKTDYQWIRNDAGTGRNQFNINLGYAY